METKRQNRLVGTREAGIVAIVVLVATILFASCSRPATGTEQAGTGTQTAAKPGSKAPGAPGAGPTQPTVFPVSVTEVVTGDLNNYIAVTGGVQASNQVDVYADTTGQLVKRYVTLGQYVRQDQVLAEVDPSRPGQNFIPNPVRAPIAGTVTALPVDVGTRITQGVPVAQISTINELEIRTQVAERYIGSIRIGESALVSLEPYPKESFAARIAELSPVVDPQTRTMEVTLRFNGVDPRIKPGMYSEIRIITTHKTGLMKIPSDAIVERGDRKFVFVLANGGTVVQRDVSIGIEIDGKAEITSGLSPGEKVVVKGQTLLANGAAVKVIEEVPPLSVEDRIL